MLCSPGRVHHDREGWSEKADPENCVYNSDGKSKEGKSRHVRLRNIPQHTLGRHKTKISQPRGPGPPEINRVGQLKLSNNGQAEA